MIYLTEVDDGCGPFEYLEGAQGKPVSISPNKIGPKKWGGPKWPGSRVPDKVMQDYVANGCKKIRITGKPGTSTMFDNNIIHRANVAETKHRDVMALQIRPALKPFRPYIDRKWTGTFGSVDVNKDPNVILPAPKPQKRRI